MKHHLRSNRCHASLQRHLRSRRLHWPRAPAGVHDASRAGHSPDIPSHHPAPLRRSSCRRASAGSSRSAYHTSDSCLHNLISQHHISDISSTHLKKTELAYIIVWMRGIIKKAAPFGAAQTWYFCNHSAGRLPAESLCFCTERSTICPFSGSQPAESFLVTFLNVLLTYYPR